LEERLSTKHFIHRKQSASRHYRFIIQSALLDSLNDRLRLAATAAIRTARFRLLIYIR